MNPRYSRYYTFIKPISRNKYVKTYSSLAFSLIAIMIFAVFAIKPTLATILVLQKNIVEQQQIAGELNQKAQNLSAGKENLSKIDPDTLSKMNDLLPPKTDVTSISDNLASIALANQASISALQFEPTDLNGETTTHTKTPTLKDVSFTFNITGSYANLVKTLNAMTTSMRLFEIDSVNINKTADNQIVMSIGGQAFYLQN